MRWGQWPVSDVPLLFGGRKIRVSFITLQECRADGHEWDTRPGQSLQLSAPVGRHSVCLAASAGGGVGQRWGRKTKNNRGEGRKTQEESRSRPPKHTPSGALQLSCPRRVGRSGSQKAATAGGVWASKRRGRKKEKRRASRQTRRPRPGAAPAPSLARRHARGWATGPGVPVGGEGVREV